MSDANETVVHSLYNGEVEIQFESLPHRYTRLKPGPPTVISGVTTKTGIIDKPGLKKWYLEQGVEGVKKHLTIGDVLTEEKWKLVTGAIKTTGETTKEKAGDIGTQMHDWIEGYVKSLIGFNMPPPAPTHYAVVNCVNGFKAWNELRKPEYIDSERLVYSRLHDSTGTLDITCRLGGLKTLVDAKSSKGVYEEYWLQIGAYYGFYNEEMAFIGGEPIVQGKIIRLDKTTGQLDDSNPIVGKDIMDELYDMFLHAHHLYNWKKGWSKRLKNLMAQTNTIPGFQIQELT